MHIEVRTSYVRSLQYINLGVGNLFTGINRVPILLEETKFLDVSLSKVYTVIVYGSFCEAVESGGRITHVDHRKCGSNITSNEKSRYKKTEVKVGSREKDEGP